MIFFKNHYINVTEGVDVISIAHELAYAIRDSKSPEGLLTVIVPAPGAGLVIITPLEDVINELKAAMEVFASEAGTTKDRLKREREIAPIVQSAIMGRTVNIPFRDSKLLIDPYDEVLLVDFDKKKGRREFVVQIISEAPAKEGGEGAGGAALGQIG